jgi:hypothetical protein
MASSVNNLTMLINRQDASGVNIENRSVGAISFSGVSGEFDVRQAPGTSITTLDLPTTLALQFYFKNTHSAANITLTGTPQGGSTQTLCVLPPGGIYVYWAPVTSATAGYTQLRYTSDTSGATFEMFIGG